MSSRLNISKLIPASSSSVYVMTQHTCCCHRRCCPELLSRSKLFIHRGDKFQCTKIQKSPGFLSPPPSSHRCNGNGGSIGCHTSNVATGGGDGGFVKLTFADDKNQDKKPSISSGHHGSPAGRQSSHDCDANFWISVR